MTEKQQGLFDGLELEPIEVEPEPVQIVAIKPDETSALEMVMATEDVQSTVQAIIRAVDEVFVLNHHSWSTFSDVISLCRHTLRRYTPGHEERYMETANRMKPDAVRAAPKVFGLLMQHFTMNERFEDVLGSVYMELASKWKQAGLGQYFTPWPVCLCMAQMTFHDMWKPTAEKPVRINEPCVGSGSMLLAARAVVAKQHGREALRYLRVYGQDIDPLCVEMAEVQLLLSDDWYMQNWMVASAGELRDHMEENDGL